MAVCPCSQSTPERYSLGALAPHFHVFPPSDVIATALGDAVAAAKSPPTAMPCLASWKAMPLIPEVGPLGIGVVVTCHVLPPSFELKTRDCAPPPEPNQASWPCVVRHSPLAAKPASPGRAGGIPAWETSCQLAPPSLVEMIWNLPFVGSDTARPCFGLKNDMQS